MSFPTYQNYRNTLSQFLGSSRSLIKVVALINYFLKKCVQMTCLWKKEERIQAIKNLESPGIRFEEAVIKTITGRVISKVTSHGFINNDNSP